MSIYSPKKYRHIYEQFYGPIPKDEEGRTYDIHHIDGNRKNNDPSNLVALSIQEHYDVHYNQGDYGACNMIAVKMRKSPELISELASKAQQKNVKNGTHNFLDGNLQRNTQFKRIKKGTHNFLGGKIQSETNQRRLSDGSHNLLGGTLVREQFRNGNHPSQIYRTCPHCGKSGKGGAMKKWHFDNCKEKTL